MPTPAGPDTREWLEADGLGGFASGTASLSRTRRYHALLNIAATPPTRRFNLVAGIDAELDSPSGPIPLSAQAYVGGVTYPRGDGLIESFTHEPWPTWTFRLPNGERIRFELFSPKGRPAVCLSWRVLLPRSTTGPLLLRVRPLLACRDHHALHHENPSANLASQERPGLVRWSVYAGVPAIRALHSGAFQHAPLWYRSFFYAQEALRGFDAVEDLASPGEFTLDISRTGTLIFEAETPDASPPPPTPLEAPAASALEKLAGEELRRRATLPGGSLARAADAYVVRRGTGASVIAGYPWFTDWGRDTFISMRGLCLATGRLADAASILSQWAGAVSQGQLPNRFIDTGDEPEYNAVDASLWFVIAAHEYLSLAQDSAIASDLRRAVMAVVEGYFKGTRFGIRPDADGLLLAGAAGVQLTWMDAKCGDWVVTPRRGKPVEVQALWINALHAAAAIDPLWRDRAARARLAFEPAFWNDAEGCLFDVIASPDVEGGRDASIRPNQLFAVGGLPLSLLSSARAAQVVSVCERDLVTPIGLRTLRRADPKYAPRYAGNPMQRDGAYHQGTVWPWLMGAFVEAWVRVHAPTPAHLPAAKAEARRRFLSPLLDHLGMAGLGHLPEIADAEEPHAPGGCPFQAWSVAEAIRLDRVVLA